MSDMNTEYITNVIRYKPGFPYERIALSPGQSDNDKPGSCCQIQL